MKKLIVLVLVLVLFLIQMVNAEVLRAGVSIDEVPNALYGSWRVQADLDTTNAPYTFRGKSIDFWNLSRVMDTITLDNPFSGAKAEISVQTIEGNLVVFSKRLPYGGNKVLTDTVTLRLEDNKFTGINTLSLEYFSLVDNHLMKTETATYHIKGEKIAGDSIIVD